MSKGEDKIAKMLSEKGLQFKREFIFPDCKSLRGKSLRFDFAVFKNGKLVVLIEVDGEQHFRYIPYFHRYKIAFQRQQEWDRRKNAYCLSKGIPLIRVPYWELDDLTFERLFTDPSMRVKNKYHNDLVEVKK